MQLDQVVPQVAQEIRECLQRIPAERIEAAAGVVDRAGRVYVAGAGRSGLAMRAFAMRLMHMGKTVHVVGDVTTPAIEEGDLLVIGSGSGSTGSLQVIAERAKKHGARLLLFTIVPDSPIASMADMVVQIPAPSSKAPNAADTVVSAQPMGSLFEQSLFVLGDVLILALMQKHGLSSDTMFARHANME